MGFVFRIYIGSVSEDMKILNQHTIFSKVYVYIDKYLEGCYKSKPEGWLQELPLHSLKILASKNISITKLS